MSWVSVRRSMELQVIGVVPVGNWVNPIMLLFCNLLCAVFHVVLVMSMGWERRGKDYRSLKWEKIRGISKMESSFQSIRKVFLKCVLQFFIDVFALFKARRKIVTFNIRNTRPTRLLDDWEICTKLIKGRFFFVCVLNGSSFVEFRVGSENIFDHFLYVEQFKIGCGLLRKWCFEKSYPLLKAAIVVQGSFMKISGNPIYIILKP